MINQVKPEVPPLLPCHVPGENVLMCIVLLTWGFNVSLSTLSSLSLQVQAKMCVVMVSGLKVTEGVLLFGKDSLLLCEGFTLSPAGDVCCRKHHPSRYGCVCCTITKHVMSICWLLILFSEPFVVLFVSFFLCQCERFLHFHHTE